MSWSKSPRMRRTLAYVDRLTGYEFEDYVARLMKDLGFKVIRTRGSRDGGADLLVEKAGYRAVVQTKRWNRQVDKRAIREVLRARLQYRARYAVVVTNSDFTRDAIELAVRSGVELWDRSVLGRLLGILSVAG